MSKTLLKIIGYTVIIILFVINTFFLLWRIWIDTRGWSGSELDKAFNTKRSYCENRKLHINQTICIIIAAQQEVITDMIPQTIREIRK